MSKYYTAERVSINSLSDITQRPAYSDSVRPLRSAFRYVVAAYSFPRKIASCAVTNCFQNHKKGYLVHTSNGRECCVCDSCANKLMSAQALKPPKPARTAPAKPAVKRQPAAKAASTTPPVDLVVITAGEALEKCQTTKQHIEALKRQDKGASWLYQSVRNFRQSYPAELISSLQSLHQQGENSPVFEQLIEADASDQQLADIEALQGLGVFQGDIRQLLIDTALKNIAAIEKQLGRYQSGETVQLREDWFDEISQAVTNGEQLLSQGQLFFTKANLTRLGNLPLDHKLLSKIKKIQWDCDKGAAAK